MKNANLKIFFLGVFALLTSSAGYCGIRASESTRIEQQTRMINGVVVDEKGDPVIGATVRALGSTEQAVTDLDGKFSINAPTGTSLSISYIGYKTQVYKAESNSVKIHLAEDNKTLNEVVVVGFGTQKKSDLTGAVSVVTGKDLANAPVTNATQALQGMVPGLQITQSNGSLEDNPSVNVRGTTTIGQGTSGSPLVLIDGMEGNLNTINPQDIESISVLKDAAASSIYGSRAPFGVILVTTKSGSKNGKVQINYNNSFRWGKPINMKHMMNSVDFASWMNDTFTNGGDGLYFSDDRMKNIVDYANAKPIGPGTRQTPDGRTLYGISSDNGSTWADGFANGIDDVDWYDVVYKNTTFSQSHNFSANGGSNQLNFYTSFNYLDQGGLMNLGQEGLKRYNATAKINAVLTKWLTMNYSMRFDREDYKRPSALTTTLYSDMTRDGWPILPLYDRNGFYYSSPSPALGLATGGVDKTQTDNIYHQIGFTIEPIKNWVTHIIFNYHINSQNRHWDSQQTFNHDVNGQPVIYGTSSNVHEGYYKENYYNFQAYSEYTKSLLEKHHFHIMGGFQAEDLRQTQFGLQTYGILIPGKPEIDITSGLGYDGTIVMPATNGSRNEWTTAGFFGRFNYDYDSRYLLEVNLRDDGTSRFRPGHQWKLFPSVYVGWNMAQEKFFQPLNNVVNLLKVRASYGSLGNQNTNNWYQTYQTMSVSSAAGDWLQNSVKPNVASAPGLVSESLTWETIQSYNLGLDWGLFNNRLTGSFDYYVRNTKNMVGNAPELPSILGTAVPVTNNTDLRTLGWELAIGWRDNLSNGLNYSINFNISDSRSKITRYPNNPTQSLSTYIEGRYINEIWGYKTIGIAKTQEEMDNHLATLKNGGQDALGNNWGAGDVMYADLNGDGKISSGSNTLKDHGDLELIGNSTPRYLFGLDMNASWKGFDLRVFLQGVMKRDCWVGGTYLFGATSGGQWWSTGISKVQDYFRDADTWSVKNGYEAENTDAYLPRPLYSDKNLQTQTRYLQNAAYIRLKNLQIGYTVPLSVVSRFGITNLRVFFSGENLLTGTKLAKQFDPETVFSNSGNGYPLSKTYSFGLSVTF